jgi:hypothetical protein
LRACLPRMVSKTDHSGETFLPDLPTPHKQAATAPNSARFAARRLGFRPIPPQTDFAATDWVRHA